MKYKYDMHIHTTCSDGEYDLEGIVKKSIIEGLYGIAITDHDVLGDNEKYIGAKEKYPQIEIISGVEIGTDISNMHILCYMKGWNDKKILNFLEFQKKARSDAAKKTCEIARSLNIPFDHDTLMNKYCKGATPGRPHFAIYLVDLGYAKTFREAFDNYLLKGKPLYVRKERKNFKEIMEIIGPGNVTALAHPYLIRRSEDEIEHLIYELIGCGIDGIEVNYPLHTQKQMDFIKDICKKNDILILGGSDFHGETIKPEINLGVQGISKEDFEKFKSKLLNK